MLFHLFASQKVSSSNLIDDSILVTYVQSKKYYGSLWLDPVASPLVIINNTSISYVSNILSGSNRYLAAKSLLEANENYQTVDELDETLNNLNLGVTWKENAKENYFF
jgi:hypothetical protein